MGNKVKQIVCLALVSLLSSTIASYFGIFELSILMGCVGKWMSLYTNSEIGLLMSWLIIVFLIAFVWRKKSSRWLITRALLGIAASVLLVAFLKVDAAANNYLYKVPLHLFGGDRYTGSSGEAYVFPILLGVVYPIIISFCFALYAMLNRKGIRTHKNNNI